MSITSSSMPNTVQSYESRKQIEVNIRDIQQAVQAASQEDKAKLKGDLKREQARLNVPSRLNVPGLLLSLLIAATVFTIIKTFVEGRPLLRWLLELPSRPAIPEEFASILAPLIAISVGIERLLETAFDWFERTTRAAADVIRAPARFTDWISKEYRDATEATERAAEAIRGKATPSPQLLKDLDAAEQRLASAEKRLRGWTDAPEYKSWKRAITIWVGLFAGLAVAIFGDLGMFRQIGIPIPRIIDLLATGLVIGAGPGPMHSLVGILQGGKDALAELSELARGRDMRESAEQLRKAAEKAAGP